MVRWTWWDWSLILRTTTSFSALTLLVGSFDPQKPVPNMTYMYNVFSGTLNPHTPFTRYNRLSNRFNNRFDNRLYRVNGASVSQSHLYNRAIHDPTYLYIGLLAHALPISNFNKSNRLTWIWSSVSVPTATVHSRYRPIVKSLPLSKLLLQ